MKFSKMVAILIIKQVSLYRGMKNEKRKIKTKKRKAILKKFVLTKEQKREIDKLFMENYGKKVPYDWHRYYASYTGNFDARFIPELLYIPKIEVMMNTPAQKEVMADKNLLPLLIPEVSGAHTAKIYLSCQKGVLTDDKHNIINIDTAINNLYDIGKVFVKPTIDSSSGQGCKIVDFKNGVDTISEKTVEETLKELGNNYNVQELIENSDDLKALHPQSLNTLRTTTYVLNGKIYHFPFILRMGVGESNLDNAHQGGYFIGVNDDGTLLDKAFTEFQNIATKHPTTGIEFKGYRINGMEKAISALHKLHSLYPQVGMISWDVTIDKDGRVIIIEMNLHGQSIWLSQMAHGKGAFLDNTKDVLKMISKK